MVVEQMWHGVPGGSGEYIVELARALEGTAELVPLAARHRGTAPLPVALSSPHQSVLPRPVLYESWNKLRLPTAERIAGRQLDVVHATTWAIPGHSAPLVVTVHDLAFLREPAHFTARGVRYFRRAWTIVRAEAAAVIVPSAATRDDCLAAGLTPERVRVVPHGVRVDAVAPGDVETWRRQRGLLRPYVLWSGTIEPRKNLVRLVEGFARARRAGAQADLVLVGPTGWGDEGGRVTAAIAGAPAGSVRLLGRVDRRELDLAYAGAAAFAYPSLWEGFGMPVLEAMAHGAPVLTSAGTSMAEVADGHATLVDPLDVDAIAGALLEILAEGRATGEDRRRALAASRTWEGSARRHLEVYVEVSRG